MYYNKKNPEEPVTVFYEEKGSNGRSMTVYFWDYMGYPDRLPADEFHRRYEKKTTEE